MLKAYPISCRFPFSFASTAQSIGSSPLKPVVLIPVPSSPFDHQLGDLADVGRSFKLAEFRIAAPDAVRAGHFPPHISCTFHQVSNWRGRRPP